MASNWHFLGKLWGIGYDTSSAVNIICYRYPPLIFDIGQWAY